MTGTKITPDKIKIDEAEFANLFATAGSAGYLRSMIQSIDYASDKAIALAGQYEHSSCLELCSTKEDIMRAQNLLSLLADLLEKQGLE